jgi:hypothetical protein
MLDYSVLSESSLVGCRGPESNRGGQCSEVNHRPSMQRRGDKVKE